MPFYGIFLGQNCYHLCTNGTARLKESWRVQINDPQVGPDNAKGGGCRRAFPPGCCNGTANSSLKGPKT